jgi:hypothetical protein
MPLNKRVAIEEICSQLDPFCRHATGAKLFDDDVGKTYTADMVHDAQIKVTNSSGIQSDGQFLVLVQVAYGHTNLTQSCLLGAQVTADWSGANDGEFLGNGLTMIPEATSVLSTMNDCRVVTAGTEVKISSPETAAAGRLYLNRLDSGQAAEILNTTNVSGSRWFDGQKIFSAHELSLNLIHHPISSSKRVEYNNETTNAQQIGFDVFLIYGVGWDVNTSVHVRSTKHLECLPNYNSVAMQFSSPSPESRPWYSKIGTVMNQAAAAVGPLMTPEHIGAAIAGLAAAIV